MKKSKSEIFWSLVVFGILVLFFAIPTLLFWNWLMPAIFGIRQITYGESVGLILLGGCIITPAKML